LGFSASSAPTTLATTPAANFRMLIMLLLLESSSQEGMDWSAVPSLGWLPLAACGTRMARPLKGLVGKCRRVRGKGVPGR
jgi:hypothetical protein